MLGEQANPHQLLPLDAPERVISWRNRAGAVRRHVFRRVTPRDMEGFYSRLTIDRDDSSALSYSPLSCDAAMLWIYSECVVRAEGYIVNNSAPIESLPEWRARIPQGHRCQAARKLLDVQRSEHLAGIEAEVNSVSLDALWSESKSGDGTMPRRRGLVHRFAAPSSEHELMWTREIEALRCIRSSGPRTARFELHRLRVELYDDLILSVEGYSVEGAPLTNSETIIREMDDGHKEVAALAVFSTDGEQVQRCLEDE